MPILKNKIFIYLVTRYLTYGLQFILSLIIAVNLGPYYLGVYGIIQLILSYCGQINFGVPHSLNILLVQNKNSTQEQNTLSLNSYVIYTYLSITVLLISIVMYLTGYTTWGDCDISNYIIYIIVIAVLTYYNSLLTVIIRCQNRINLLSICGTIPVLCNLLVVFLFEEESLVLALTIANAFSCALISVLGFSAGALPKINLDKIKIVIQRQIIRKGLYLFFYNSCFYFILIVVRSLISSNYTVEEFGFFTFSYTIANAVMLLLDSMGVIIFPKTVDLLSSSDVGVIKQVLYKLRIGYITTSHLMIYLAMIFFPLLLFMFPKYESSLQSLNMVALAILMNTNSYGYSTMLVAQNKEKKASVISIIALLVTIFVGLGLVYIFRVSYAYVVISVLIAYTVFSYLSTYEGEKLLTTENKVNKVNVLWVFFPCKLLVPYLIALVISLLELEYLVILPLVVFVCLNSKDINYLLKIISRLTKNPNIIDL